MYYTIGLFIVHTFILLFRFHFLALLRQHPSHNCRFVFEDWDYYRWSWKIFLQLCDSIMDCPLHESGAGGEDEEDCDGEHFQDSVTKYSSARVSYSRKWKWKWWWRHILKLSNLFEKMSSVNQIIYSFHKYNIELFKHCLCQKKTCTDLGAFTDIRYF